MKTQANQITAHNAGWRSQFRFAVHVIWSRVPELWTLGCFAFMRLLILALLSSLLLCGCSRKQPGSSSRAIDLVEAGKDVVWSGGEVLHVASRSGSEIQGIHLLTKGPDGLPTTLSADKGTVSEGSDPHTVKITLYDGRSQSTKARAPFKEVTVELAR